MGVLRGYEQLIQKFCGLPFPLFHNMCILPQSKSGTCVTDKLLYGLWRLPCFEQVGDYGMPLRYNYDKPEKPRISRVFGYQARFFILFQPEKTSREVIEAQEVLH